MKRIAIAFLSAAVLNAMPAHAEPARYASPEDAVAAIIVALEARDRDALIAIFGAENEEVILSGDPERDRSDWGGFLEGYREMHRVALQEDGTARLFVGTDQWPFPIRLTEGDGGWSFDTATARDEILERRIGRNELDVIELMQGYVRVQSEFRQIDHDGDGVMEFAAHIISDAETRDGLYWPAAPGIPDSPIGDFMARAAAEGYAIDGQDAEPEPYLGYYFQVLTQQGDGAPGGAMSYIVNGNMVAGHALLAVPSAYGDTGVMSFLVGENGVVFEADLGEETLETAAAIDSFNPVGAWAPVD